ncbi:MAG: glycosyltransferase family 4 protein [Acidimicrobiales bacterium]|nr:glycosyltransferase family 4 protein [Acidimicrobiales bacterium]
MLAPVPETPAQTPRPLDPDGPLRIAYLCYRGKPHVGGQGVYTRHLTKALVDLGHTVDVLGGQPYPILDERVPLIRLPSLDIYNDHYPMRMPGLWELKTVPDWIETAVFMSGSFPEPLSFSLRAWQYLKDPAGEAAGRYDVVHDNQCLGYGLLGMERAGLPVIATIHHPITVDKRLEMEAARSRYEKWSKARWHGFTRMQIRVARRMRRVITVSENSHRDIQREFSVPGERMAVIPVGVDIELFKPLPDVAVVPGRIITTASADVALKGLRYLLEALAKVRVEHPEAHLVLIGRRKPGGPSDRTIAELGLEEHVTFVTGVPEQRIIELYAESELAVVPSLYEGFSLPAIEAQSCGVPLIATTGGAIPEVVGRDGDTAALVEPGDADALAVAIGTRLGRGAELRAGIGARGRQRVVDNWSWTIMAARTAEQYRLTIEDKLRHPGLPAAGAKVRARADRG